MMYFKDRSQPKTFRFSTGEYINCCECCLWGLFNPSHCLCWELCTFLLFSKSYSLATMKVCMFVKFILRLCEQNSYSHFTSRLVCSVTQPCLTLCKPMDCSMPGFPVHHQLPELTQTHVHWVGDAIQPSHPLLSPSPPAFSLSQHQGLFQWVSSSHQVAKVLEFQLQHQSFQWTFRTDFF